MLTNPLVSIVMPSLNQAEFIPQAVASVLEQSWRNLELIVADGGSTDGSLQWLRERQASDGRLRVYSGPDTGPAQALNQALQRARGTVIGWLNSDDVYLPGAVDRAVQAFRQHPEWLMVYGHGQHIDAGGKVIELYPSKPADTPAAEFEFGCFICQPSVFFQRSLYVLLGRLDECLKTAFDFDYWLRAFTRVPERIGFIDALQARSRLHAECITLRLRSRATAEGMLCIKRHLGVVAPHWAAAYLNGLADQGLEREALVQQHAQLLQELDTIVTADELTVLQQAIGHVAADLIPHQPDQTPEPRRFDEAGYLQANPDVAFAVRNGHFSSGQAHFEQHGRQEGREARWLNA